MKPQSFKIHSLVLGLYLALTLILTYPLALNFSTAIPGDVYDAYKLAWDLWWPTKALLELRSNPFFSDYIFYPLGTTLVFDTIIFVSALLAIPLQSVFGFVATHNILIVLSFVLSAYGTYLLIYHLTSNGYAAFVGGIIFAFCPYKFAHLRAHFHLMTTEGIPFYALYLFKTIQEPSKRRHALLAGLFFLITALQSGYYAVYLGIFTVIYFIFLFFQDRRSPVNPSTLRNPVLWKNLGVLVLVVLIGLSPILYLAFKTVQGNQVTLTEARDYAIKTSADLMSFFYPSTYHSLWRYSDEYVYLINQSFRGGNLEADVFIGYSALILALYAFFSQYKHNPSVKFWGITALINFILALGPFLQIHGFLFRKIYGYPLLYLPYNLVYFIPIVREARTPSRFAIMVMLAIAVLVAYACIPIFSGLQTQKAVLIQTMVLVLLILLEYISIPFPLFNGKVPPLYYELSKEPGDFTIMEIPLGWSDGQTHWGTYRKDLQYFQIIHGKRILNGHGGRISSDIFEYYNQLPVISTIFKLQIGELNNVSEETLFQDRERAKEVLNSLRVKYILFHPDIEKSLPSQQIHKYLMKILEFRKVEVKDGIVVYALP
jgi:hypothetical protein